MSAQSTTSSTLRWTFTSMALAVVAVVTLLAVGEVYGGTDVEVGATIDGEPTVEQLVGSQSGADVRNASVVLGLIGLAILMATYFYWRHTGRAARRRHRAGLIADALAVDANAGVVVEPGNESETAGRQASLTEH